VLEVLGHGALVHFLMDSDGHLHGNWGQVKGYVWHTCILDEQRLLDLVESLDITTMQACFLDFKWIRFVHQ
jgi:hypothetical protein